MNKFQLIDCRCLETGPEQNARSETPQGIDKTHGRFGEVFIWTCDLCGQNWLRYHVQYEAFQKSGRWFMGILGPGLNQIHPRAAADALAQLEWYLAGGSYYNGKITRKSGPPDVDLYGTKPGTGAQFVCGTRGRLEIELYASPDWDSFDLLVRFLKKFYSAKVLQDSDGPDARSWDLEIDGHKIVAQHLDTRGNYLFASDKTGESTLIRLGEDIAKRLAGLAPVS